MVEFSTYIHLCLSFHWPLFYLICLVIVFYTLICMFYIALRTHSLSFFTIKVLTHFFQVCRLHKSFSLSLPLFSPSPFFLRGGSEYVLEGSIPRHLQHSFSSSYLLSFTSPTVSSSLYCQQLGISEHLSEALFLLQLYDLYSVGYCLFIWFAVKSGFFLPNCFNA